MRTFDLLTPADAVIRLNTALDAAGRKLGTEIISVFEARDRILARDVISLTPLPEFRRSTVDGYAVRAMSVPGVLRVTGEIKMGELSTLTVRLGEAVQIPTGGFVPEGADAVVMVEQTTSTTNDGQSTTAVDAIQESSVVGGRSSRIQTPASLSIGDNIIQAGEDVKEGEIVIRAGARLREPEIGGVLALGITLIEVVKQPRVVLIASGDELVPANAPVKLGQIRNINAPMLAAMVRRSGGVPIDFGILPDQRSAFEEAAARAMQEADVVVFMAGSSVGERDFVPDIVNAMGTPGILAHGIQFRPGKPTLFAVCDGKPVFGLPGNPISALVTGNLFVAPTLWRVQQALAPPQPSIVRATLAKEVRSPKDLEHWLPVTLTNDPNLPRQIAQPISTKSNLIFGLVRASGLICVPIGTDRVAPGSAVDVQLFD